MAYEQAGNQDEKLIGFKLLETGGKIVARSFLEDFFVYVEDTVVYPSKHAFPVAIIRTRTAKEAMEWLDWYAGCCNSGCYLSRMDLPLTNLGDIDKERIKISLLLLVDIMTRGDGKIEVKKVDVGSDIVLKSWLGTAVFSTMDDVVLSSTKYLSALIRRLLKEAENESYV